MAFFDVFKRTHPQSSAEGAAFDRGLLIFENTSEVIQAERVLKAKGWEIRVMGPPPEIRSGCDLVIEIPLIEELNILRSLQEAGALPKEALQRSRTRPTESLEAYELFLNEQLRQHG